MKNTIKAVLIVLCAIMLMCSSAYAETSIAPSVLVNDVPVVFPDVEPIVVNDRTLVPVRGVFEHLGCTVTWIEEQRSVEIRRSARLIIMVIDNPYISIGTVYDNGEAVHNRDVTLDVPPQVINGRTMIPLRAVADCLGSSVEWLGAINTVKITDESVAGSVQTPPVYTPPVNVPVVMPIYPSTDFNANYTEEYVHWYDSEFEFCVRNLLGIDKGAVRVSDCLTMTYLDLTGYDIRSLEDLRYFENLESLYISDAYRLDIGPISQLDELRELQISYCGVEDIDALCCLENLEYLDLCGNEIEDISPLENLPKLEALYLDDNMISDITGIRNIMDSLDVFSIFGNPVYIQELIYDDEDFYEIFDFIVHQRNELGRTPVVFNEPCVNYIMNETEEYYNIPEYSDYLQEVYMLEADDNYYDFYILDAEDFNSCDSAVEWLLNCHPDIADELIYAKHGNRTMYASLHYSDDYDYIILQIMWGY